ncbi:MAG: diacylglycerol kinase family protein [Elusimicrobiales bacterium]
MDRSFYFIINPNAGRKTDARNLAEAVTTLFAGRGRAECAFTSGPGHALELARGAVASGFDAVVVAAGDGTINEALPALCGSRAALGLVPRGSGNGLAREFSIPLAPRRALEALLKWRPRRIDLGKINGEYFANVAGIGIDALIGEAFNSFGRKGPRGKLPYYYFGLRQYVSYKPPRLELECGGKTSVVKPLCLAFANCRQFGGGAVIAPSAKPDDGLLNIVTVDYRPWYQTVRHLHKLFDGSIESSSLVSAAKSASALVRGEGEIVYHIDGEPRRARGAITVETVPSALAILQGPES